MGSGLTIDMIMTNDIGSVVWQGEFLPFGEQFSITGSV